MIMNLMICKRRIRSRKGLIVGYFIERFVNCSVVLLEVEQLIGENISQYWFLTRPSMRTEIKRIY